MLHAVQIYIPFIDPKVIFEFGGGEGAIFLDGILCGGSEANLLQCIHNEIEVHDCSHYEDAGISCGNPSIFILVVLNSNTYNYFISPTLY